MNQLKLAALSLVAFLLLGAATASAIAPPAKPPKPGTWERADGTGGLTVTAGKGKKRGTLYVSNIHGVTDTLGNCTGGTPVSVGGTYPLKTFSMNGANFYGVGRAAGFELLRIPAKLSYEGQTVDGKFSVSFSQNGIRTSLFIEVGLCSADIDNIQRK